MPASLIWPRYLLFCSIAALTTMAGSEIVHQYYKPLDDLEELVQQALEQRRKDKTYNCRS
ncbi:uncharacterized protein LOC106644783 [Copidosoma floridanum]|uniref:uncharacterized protein LOC106644783 n=1 Tax=Copidosoma floridanum TaxID=29053 RepID=UPI0006C95636|nr:uncharacterized protein LOC106644783 [Copidosoma floridanum]